MQFIFDWLNGPFWLTSFLKHFLINTFILCLYFFLLLAVVVYGLLFIHIIRCQIDEDYIFRGQD